MGRHADRIGHERCCAGGNGSLGKGPVAEQPAGDLRRDGNQRHRRRQHHEGGKLDALGKRPARRSAVTGPELCGQARQQCGAKRHPDDAKRQLRDAIREVKPGDRSHRKKRCQHQIDDQIHLHGDRPGRSDAELPPHAAHRSRKARPPPGRHAFGAAQQPRHHAHLQHTGGKKRHSKRHGLFASQPAVGTGDHQRTGYQAKVEDDRHRRRGHETSIGIGDGGPEGDKRNHRKIGEGYPGKTDGGGHPVRRLGKTGSQHPDDRRHENFAEDDQRHQHQHQCRLGFPSQRHRRLVAIILARRCKGRHKGVRQRPFGRQPAEHVGKLQGYKKSIRRQPGAKQRRKDDVTAKTQQPACRCHTANLPKGAGQRLRAHSAASPSWSKTDNSLSRMVASRASLWT